MSFESLSSCPQYYPTLIRSTGLLSGEERERRVSQLIDINIWLAAKCKNTCVLAEEAITNAIILNCISLFESEHDSLAIVALLELRSIIVVCRLSHVNERIGLLLNNDSDQSVPHLFCELGRCFAFDLFWDVYHKIEELGYPISLEMYNLALSRLPKKGDPRSILTNMELSGIKADAKSYYHLIQNSTSYQDALVYFHLFLNENCKDGDLINEVVRLMIGLAPSRDFVNSLFQSAQLDNSDAASAKRVMIAYYSRLIALADSYQECYDTLQGAKMWFSSSPLSNATFFTLLVPPFCDCIEKNQDVNNDLFFRTISLFLDISFIGQPKGYFRTSRISTQNRLSFERAIKRVINRLSPKTKVFSLFNILVSYNIQIRLAWIWKAIEAADTVDYLQQLLSVYDIGDLPASNVVHLFKVMNEDTAEYFYNYLVDIHYPITSLQLCALLKSCSQSKRSYYINEISKQRGDIDNETILFLINQFQDKEEFLTALSIASNSGKETKKPYLFTLGKRASQDKQIRGIVLSIKDQDIEQYGISPDWRRFVLESQLRCL